MILVTGATGTIGSHLVPSLLGQGAHVRVLVRDPDKARAAFGDRVDIVSGDLQDTSSVTVALKGVDSVFLNSPSLEGFVEMQRTLIDAAAATGSLLMQAHEQGDNAAQLIERLSARLGQAQVCVWQSQANHRPEQMQRWVSAQGERQAGGKSAIKVIANSPRISCLNGLNNLQNSASEALYPTWLLPEPLRLAAVAGRPVYQGPLVRLAGPQRLEACGWLMRHDPASGNTTKPVLPAIRDYFIYRSQQAGLLWIYSERLAVTPPAAEQRAWYLHGVFA